MPKSKSRSKKVRVTSRGFALSKETFIAIAIIAVLIFVVFLMRIGDPPTAAQAAIYP